MYMNFLSILIPKICLVHINTIFTIYTPWETLEKFRFTLPHFPLHVYMLKNYFFNLINSDIHVFRLNLPSAVLGGGGGGKGAW